MAIRLFLLSLFFAYISMAMPIYADQIQIDSNSIQLKTEQLAPLPTQQMEKSSSPIVVRHEILEHSPSSPISLSISPDTLIFDPLAPTNPLLRNSTVIVDGQAGSLFVDATQPLQASVTKIIPPTSCDNGECDASTADIWNNNLTFGFGYRCENIEGFACNNIFKTPSDYININQSLSYTTPWAIQNLNDKRIKAQIIYKINIPNTQQAGMYSTTIHYVLIPNL